MAPFPDNLPPEGLDPIYKLLLYYGLIFLLATAITTWLITRRRSFPKPTVVEAEAQTTDTVAEPTMNITDLFNFQGTAEKLASLIIEEYANEKALGKLRELRDQVNPDAYSKINIMYNDRLAEIKMEIDSIQESMVSDQPSIQSAETEESIDEDLERQLMDLDDDDFLKPRKKRDIDEIFEEETPATTQMPTPVEIPQTAPVRTTPTESTPTPAPSQPKAAAPIPPPPARKEVKAATPTSPPPESTAPAPMPPAPTKKATPPPPPGKASTPSTAPPAAPTPSASEPLSAAQPMKVQSEGEDAMFAKSTSIAALRMDMLRELARLKKLIPEDQERE